MRSFASPWGVTAVVVTLIMGGGACAPAERDPVLVLGGIPDQDHAMLEERFGRVADALSARLGVEVRYAPANDYAALVTAFEHGDVQLAWFGGLTGVQARRAVPGARAIVQRPRDAEFRSVFIVRAGLEASGLSELAGSSFTFGSDNSTSGHLMPRHFLAELGIDPGRDFAAVNHSGSHDATLQLVEDAIWDAGALNEAVWDRAVRERRVDTTRVRVLQVTEPYYDYHWVVHPELDEHFGDGVTDRIVEALLSFGTDPDAADMLEMFETGSFIATHDENYSAIEAVAEALGMLGER